MDRALDISRVALKRRRTKIVATVGPASSELEVLNRLVAAGVDVFRMNFSHGTHESHAKAYENIRIAAANARRPVAILADLCGPKIRVGEFDGGAITLVAGEPVLVSCAKGVRGKPGLIPSEYAALASDVKPGDRILLDDGKLELRVRETGPAEIACEVVQGGRLSNRKGMNLPGVKVSAPSLTDKDKDDATFAARLGVDYLALSFVRSASDVRQLKMVLGQAGVDVPIIAKIEKPEALEAIVDIINDADGIMVARGDLGVEMAAEEVPLIQQELLRLANAAHKPVIVATQMLESMIDNPRPTRAEVSDVASAALSRADAVMLSAETASGKFPLEAVQVMDRVLRQIEGWQWKHGAFGRPPEWAADPDVEPGAPGIAAAISRATSVLSRELHVRAVVVPTRGGRTARVVSASRPAAPIVAVTASESVARRLALLWGVAPEMAAADQLKDPVPVARSTATKLGLAEKGQHIVLVWDSSPLAAGLAPTVSVLAV